MADMTIANIEEIFKNYLSVPNTQYAILINGSWGCGKTHLWKFRLDHIAKENFKTIYLSLNGISKIEDLDRQLFIKLLPFFNNQENRAIKNFTKLFGNLLNKISIASLKVNWFEVFNGLSIDAFDFSTYLICFDDLERCKIPMKEVLGYINNLVEHRSLKTIILANESEINGESEYGKIKEKVIGRDLKFKADLFSLLPELFIKHNNDAEFFNFLSIQKNTLAETFIYFQQENLRIVIFCLEILQKLFPILKNYEEKYMQEVVFFASIISIEYKTGGLTSSDFNDYKGIDKIDEYYHSLRVAQALNKSKEEKVLNIEIYMKYFYDKYLRENIKKYHFFPSVYCYILSGLFNQVEFETEIKKRHPEVVPKEIQDLNELLSPKFRELPNDEFNRLVKDVLKNAKNGKFRIYDYINIASFFIFFPKIA